MTGKQLSKYTCLAGIAILLFLPTLSAANPTPTPPPTGKRGKTAKYSITRTNVRTQSAVATTSRSPARRISTNPNLHRPTPTSRLVRTREVSSVHDRNPPSPAPGPSGKPDLVFVPAPSQGSSGVLSNGKPFVRFHVKNIGPGPSATFHVSLLIYETGDGGKIIDVKHEPVEALKTNHSSIVTFTIPEKYVHKNAYRASIDPDDSVKESNEKNNVTMLYQFGAFPKAGD